MNTHHPRPDPRADEAAALWAARLEGGTLSSPDAAALQAWLAADPAHRPLLADYTEFSADLAEVLPVLADERGATRPAAEPAAARRRIWPAFAGVALAAAAAVAVVAWMGPRTQTESVTTADAQRQTVRLADGTQVELNAHTRLEVAIGRHERRVRLPAGQAFFAVSKDASRPFFVDTPAGAVRVTGTAFDVRIEPGRPLEVTVTEGAVQVQPAAAGPVLRLGPGDQFAAAAVRRLSPKELADALAWRSGQIVFDGTPLQEALDRFAHYHGRVFAVAPDAADLRVGGRYSLDDPEGFLTALEIVLPVKVRRDGGAIRCERRQKN